MEILNELKKICKIFNEKNINYILIGGLAIFLHNIPRYTEDIDFKVALKICILRLLRYRSQ